LEISWVAFLGYFSLFCINIQEVVLKFQYLNKKLLITCEYYWHFNLNIFFHPTFALITYFNQINKDNAVDIHDVVDRYGIFVSQMNTNMLHLSKSQSGRFFSFMTCHRVSKKSNMTDATLTEHPGFKWGSCCSIFIILCNGL